MESVSNPSSVKSVAADDSMVSTVAAEENIDGKIVQGSVWLFGLKIATRAAAFLSSLILARLLAPSDFGTLGIALLAMSLLQRFSQTGFDAALVQRKGNIGEFLDSAWTISVVRGLILSTMLYLSAHWVAVFFNAPRAEDVLRVLAISPLLMGLKNVGIIFFDKEMNFKKTFIYQVSGNVVNGVVAVVLAITLRSVWALVFGFVASQLMNILLSYVLHPYRPRFDFKLARARELFRFGKWILGTQIVLFFVNRGDNLFVGKFLGPAALGLYGLAFNIAYLPFTEVTMVLFKVMFPAYARIQDNKTVLRHTYQKTIQLLAFVSIPFAGSILVFAADFTRLFLGAKWMPMVGSLQILSLSAACLALGGSAGNLLQGIGKPNVVMNLVSVRLVILGAMIYPCTLRWGLEGVALAVLASGAGIGLFQIYWGARVSKCDFKAVLLDLCIPLVGVLLGALLTILLRGMSRQVGFVAFFVLAALFIGTYFSVCYLAERLNDYQAFTRLRRVFLKLAHGAVV